MAPASPVLQIWGPLSREDLPGLYRRACAQLSHAAGGVLTVDVGGVAPDAVAVDAVARLQLAARRHGCRVTLRGAGQELCWLMELMGLTGVFFSPAGTEARTAETDGPCPGRT